MVHAPQETLVLHTLADGCRGLLNQNITKLWWDSGAGVPSTERVPGECLLVLWNTKGCKFPGFSHSLSLWNLRVKGMFALVLVIIWRFTVISWYNLPWAGVPLLLRPRPAWFPAGDYWISATWEKQGFPSGSPLSPPQPALFSASNQNYHKDITVVKISHMCAIR